jgi:pyroglutamyl-peptidase
MGTGQFEVVLMLGVAGHSEEIRLERFAHNRDDAEIPDCDGCQPDGSLIVHGAAESYECQLSLPDLLNHLESSGISSQISESAGEYVCNHVYFHALDESRALNDGPPCLFLHLPPAEATFGGSDRRPTLPIAAQIHAIRQVLIHLQVQHSG